MAKFSDSLDEWVQNLARDHDQLEAQVGGRGRAEAVTVVLLARIAFVLALGFRQTVRAIGL